MRFKVGFYNKPELPTNDLGEIMWQLLLISPKNKRQHRVARNCLFERC